MDILNIRREMRTKSIYDIPLRVTYYARVSSDTDEQLNSLGNQIQYFEDFIGGSSCWTLVPGYIDEGLSGISTKKRENFNRMLDDAARDKFDLIITKEISRFARNTLDSIMYARQLLADGVGVLFHRDNINTLDEDSELRLAIMSSIAQDELRKLSSRVKFGHQQAIKNNVVLGNGRIFGYVKKNKHLAIDEDEAPMVRELFELYATDRYSMKQIETIFWDKGYRNRNGNKIAHTTMSNIISNPKYKGWYVGNKVKIIDMFTKKQKFLPPEEWVSFKDESGEIVPAIVSEELWERANEILRRRSEDVKNRQGICNHPNLLTGKLICTECGSPYYRRESKEKNGNRNSKWVCSGKIKNGSAHCRSFAIFEREIAPIILEVFGNTKNSSESLISEYERLYESVAGSRNTERQISAEEARIAAVEKKKLKLLDLVTDGSISDSDFREMMEKCNRDADRSRERIDALHAQEQSLEDFQNHMTKIRETLREAEENVAGGIVTKEFVDMFIDKIYVTPVDSETMKLDIHIYSGDSTVKYLKRLKSQAMHKKAGGMSDDFDVSTGQMVKKMIESYENSIGTK